MIEIISSDPIQILDRFAESIQEEPVTLEALKNAYDDFQIPPEPPLEAASPAFKEIEISVHCELTLLVFMVQRRLETRERQYVSMTIEIGTSKSTCWACQAYMEYLEYSYRTPGNRKVSHRPFHDLHCVVSDYSGRIIPGWKMPAGRSLGNDWLLPEALASIEIQHILAHVHELQQYDLEWELCSNEALPDTEDYMEMNPKHDSTTTGVAGTGELSENDTSGDERSRTDVGIASFGNGS